MPEPPHWVKEMDDRRDLNHDRVNGSLPVGIE
jgi:hypothetical protein